MKEFDHYEIVDIERPVYFLCGPNINDSQKRNVFSSFLKKHYEKQLRLYSYAAERITGRKVVSATLFNLKTGDRVEL